jgi:ParB-like chromosome segregation protein Spo0J
MSASASDDKTTRRVHLSDAGDCGRTGDDPAPPSTLAIPDGSSSEAVLRQVRHLMTSGGSPISERVRVDALRQKVSPRSRGLDPAHIQRLVEAEWPLPPILVHRDTLEVIDGHHRVAAALMRGFTEMDAILVDGTPDVLFIIAVGANVMHGLPLSLGDRRAAAATILTTHGHWADRAIAAATGLSAKTVRELRCASAEKNHLHARLGRDGRVRPLNTAAGRQLAAELLTARPRASLREIASAVGISAGTVRDVRSRLSRGDNPVPTRLRRNGPGERENNRQASSGSVSRRTRPADVSPVLTRLSKDPALRMNAAGRALLQWLHTHAVNTADGAKIGDFVPEHCLGHLVDLATRCSANWAQIAEDLQLRLETSKSGAAVIGIETRECSSDGKHGPSAGDTAV